MIVSSAISFYRFSHIFWNQKWNVRAFSSLVSSLYSTAFSNIKHQELQSVFVSFWTNNNIKTMTRVSSIKGNMWVSLLPLGSWPQTELPGVPEVSGAKQMCRFVSRACHLQHIAAWLGLLLPCVKQNERLSLMKNTWCTEAWTEACLCKERQW